MATWGLGGYGSEEDDDEEMQDAPAAGPDILSGASILRGYSDLHEDDAQPRPEAAAAAAAAASGREPASPLLVQGAAFRLVATLRQQNGSPSPAPSAPPPSALDSARFNAAPSPGPSPAPGPPPGRSPGPAGAKDLDPFSLLPPELLERPGPCPEALQDQFRKYLDKQKATNRTINDELRRSRAYKNPDLLHKLVEHFKIQECGSAFRKEVFDPKALPQGDFIDALIKQLDAEQTKRAKERAEREAGRGGASGGPRGIEFAKGPTLPAAGGVTDLQRAAAAQAAARTAKGSKWDAKVVAK